MAESVEIFARSGRLLLRRFQADDAASFHAYRTDPEVSRFQPWEKFGRREATAFVDGQSRGLPDQRGHWFQFAVELADTGGLIGYLGLHTPADEPRIVEIGFTLAREHQGKGYGAEAVLALLGYVFGTLAKHKVIAFVDVRNTRSIALLERVGMRREGHLVENFRVHDHWVDEFLYAMLRREWEGRARTPTR